MYEYIYIYIFAKVVIGVLYIHIYEKNSYRCSTEFLNELVIEIVKNLLEILIWLSDKNEPKYNNKKIHKDP